MASPVWQTASGLLGVINERDYYSVTLSATDADGDDLTYSVIAGTLPTGIELTSDGILRGVPTEVATRSLYTFVVRASDGTNVADRSFSLQIQGADVPVFSTASGQLDLSDSTRVGNKWVLDGSFLSFQVVATDTDTATGQTLVYDIAEGSLPPGITMSTSGLISGTVLLTDDDRFGDIGGYDNTYAYDDIEYDPIVRQKSRSKNFEFTVRVSDGSNAATQINSIFVYTADFWRVDNNRITVDQNTFEGVPLVMSLSANRRPIFETDSALGSFRHDNQVVIKIDVVDFDSLQGALTYSIVDGALPTGLTIDSATGEISGQLGVQAAVSVDYNFTVRASREPISGATVFEDKNFSMTVIGNVDVGVEFTSATNLGTVIAGIPSLVSLEATTVEENRVLEYAITTGSLPTGLTLSKSGNIIGKVDKTEFTTVDENEITFDTNTLSFDRKYTFTVSVGDNYQTVSTSKEFNLTVSLPYGVEYGNMTAEGFVPSSDKDLFYQIAQDPNINNTTSIFRSEDPSFGMPNKPEMLLIAGVQHQTLNTLQSQMEQNHTPKSLFFGELKTAVAKENNTTKYEVVYVEMKDNLINNAGTSISSEITLRQDINKPRIGALADANKIKADFDIYDVTTDGGLSFSVAGSKIRYANLLTADLGNFEKLFPNSVVNMRSRIKSLGQREYVHLPLWMRTSQDGSGVPLGYKMAIVLAYCNPGESGKVRKRILDKNIDFKKINFVIDRYRTDINFVDTGTITTDGSTTNFEMNELVHDEDIKIRNDSVQLRFGKLIKADNNLSPTYLSADTLIRSADFEPDFNLSHDATTKKTTINFTNAPTSTSKIRVERKGDKYLAFKKKLKE